MRCYRNDDYRPTTRSSDSAPPLKVRARKGLRVDRHPYVGPRVAHGLSGTGYADACAGLYRRPFAANAHNHFSDPCRRVFRPLIAASGGLDSRPPEIWPNSPGMAGGGCNSHGCEDNGRVGNDYRVCRLLFQRQAGTASRRGSGCHHPRLRHLCRLKAIAAKPIRRLTGIEHKALPAIDLRHIPIAMKLFRRRLRNCVGPLFRITVSSPERSAQACVVPARRTRRQQLAYLVDEPRRRHDCGLGNRLLHDVGRRLALPTPREAPRRRTFVFQAFGQRRKSRAPFGARLEQFRAGLLPSSVPRPSCCRAWRLRPSERGDRRSAPASGSHRR
jgi:hypothetical protein